MAELDFTGNPPAERVQAYLDAIDEHDRNGYGITYGENVHAYNDIELTRVDLRDVLSELHEHMEILRQIDEALDDGGTSEAIARVRRIMGRAGSPDELETLRRLHEEATARSARFRTSVESIIEAFDRPSMNGWAHDVPIAIEAARKEL